MSKLRIADNLALPLDAVTQTFGVLAKRGVGKTYTAAVFVEELLKADRQVVVVDPIGVWFGLRSSADGKQAGLPIIVMGGDHGDVPLEVTAGSTIADFITEQKASVVLDLSRFRKGEQVRFMTDFAETLYHKNRDPLMLVVDEADAFAPQRPQKGEERLLGAMEDLVRRGRARGLGVMLVTQRAAVLNKNVLTQVEVLVVLRTIAPQDRDAIDAWVKVYGTEKQRDTLMGSLASLKIGEAWFWSPGWLDTFQRVQVRRRETFDSSATPKQGETRKAPKKLADVDLAALTQRIAATIEKAKAEDPRELRKVNAEKDKRIKELEAELSKPVHKMREVSTKRVEVLTDADRALLEKFTGRLEAFAGDYRNDVDALVQQCVTAMKAVADDRVANLREMLDAKGFQKILLKLNPRLEVTVHASPAAKPATIRALHQAARAFAEKPPSVRQTVVVGDVVLTPAKQRILNALAFLEGIGVSSAERAQLALLADTTPSSSAYANNLGALRTAGFVDYPGQNLVSLSGSGRAAADGGAVPSTSAELHEVLRSKLPPAKWKIVAALIDAYPNALPKQELAQRADTTPDSSAYSNNLGSLRSLGLLDYPSPGHVIAESVLFLEGR